jgi:hypothetical protein
MRNKPIVKIEGIDRDDWTQEHCDVCEFELIQEQDKELQVEELVEALAKYCRQLEKQVVSLRRQANRLTPSDKPKPFPELHSDLYESFYQYATYPRFKHILKCLE